MSAQPNPSDLAALLPNVVIFIVAVIASVAGVYKALREIKKPETTPGTGPSTFQAGVILDNVSIALWAESNKAVEAAIRDLIKVGESVKASNYAVRDEMKDTAHQMERLRDAMERRR